MKDNIITSYTHFGKHMHIVSYTYKSAAERYMTLSGYEIRPVWSSGTSSFRARTSKSSPFK